MEFDFFKWLEQHTVLVVLGSGVGIIYVVYKFFNLTEGILSRDIKDTIALHLLEANPARGLKSWPETFAEVFDGVFTKKHLSWKCFFRSSVASVAAVAFMMMVYLLWPGHRENHSIVRGGDLFIFGLGMSFFGAVLNLLPDYVSLLETRYVIRWMARARSGLRVLSLVLLDALLTTGIFGMWLWFCLMVLLWEGGVPTFSEAAGEMARFFFEDLLYLFVFDLDVALGFAGFSAVVFNFGVLGIFLWSTFFTSVWVWLYALSGLVVRAAVPLTRGLALFRKTFDVENKPLSSMGYVAGGLAASGWWGICLISWLGGNGGS